MVLRHQPETIKNGKGTPLEKRPKWRKNIKNESPTRAPKHSTTGRQKFSHTYHFFTWLLVSPANPPTHPPPTHLNLRRVSSA
eukprot:SAG22_NODE_1657_length_3885_cov_6.187005_5_plen_81_part_01